MVPMISLLTRGKICPITYMRFPSGLPPAATEDDVAAGGSPRHNTVAAGGSPLSLPAFLCPLSYISRTRYSRELAHEYLVKENLSRSHKEPYFLNSRLVSGHCWMTFFST